ncbi:cyclic lactone autoinducer peptide [Paenibacillus hexagrammi]
MKTFIANLANRLLNASARKQAKTGCFFSCYEQELPEELQKYRVN